MTDPDHKPPPAEDDARTAAAIRARISTLNAALEALQSGSRERDWVGLKTASGLCGYNRETVRLWAESRSIAARRNGAGWEIDVQSVFRLIAQKSGRLFLD